MTLPAAFEPGAVTPPRLAASVILARNGERGLEVFMVRRNERSHMAPSAYVFPGGSVRADDAALDWIGTEARARLPRVLNERSDARVAEATATSLYVSALRELFEEAGVLLSEHAAEAVERREGIIPRLAEARARLLERTLSLREVVTYLLLEAGFDRVVPFSHWVTPEGLAVRFDTWFFVAAMPDDQEAQHCTIETTDGAWLRPADAVQGGREGHFTIVYPTERHLLRIAPFENVEALLSFARQKPIRRVLPGIMEKHGEVVPVMPDGLENTW